ncbi:hypothetical protein MtrunA17_Chr5g0403191 [Medicago truncatula]|uniref:CAP, cysteine-rich secretory protein, antigen 5 n=1 Tax=Medicago truncatula TaxID=3880 RepID=A0A072UNX1_MEDTR|nr:STS14 protein [Medicago truncatula]KEH27545.1 CAP, cysteine-rich secretory protein, antigen 5 [Medicago truncatula]RHN54115.1 hypothetical protein MtrunA17_Chr5g0403191 [Medicago truncatula]
MACGLANLTASKYGGNQLWVSIGEAIMPSSVVKLWVRKKELYIHVNDTCVNHEFCHAYRQVVWKKSVQLGCSQATCTDKKEAGLTICFYDPPAPRRVIGESPF